MVFSHTFMVGYLAQYICFDQQDAVGFTSISTEQGQRANKHLKLGHSVKAQPMSHNYVSFCIANEQSM